MFPSSFALKTIKKYTKKGDAVLDPFAGRGTAVFAAAITGRCGLGIEINPVGWVYARTKLAPATKDAVLDRLQTIRDNAWRYRIAADRLPIFFHYCYCDQVRRFLVTARNWLDWRNSSVDRTLMALLLVHLHGKKTDAFSNQMRQTKALSPPYAIQWWQERGLEPPEVDPVAFMEKKIQWRYAKGRPAIQPSQAYFGDSVNRLRYLPSLLPTFGVKSVKLLLTSPPYCGVTNYHYDQWLRLWLLGGPSAPTPAEGPNRGKFVDRVKYRRLLEDVFDAAAPMLAKDATVYVRTDSREITLDATVEVLKSVFPKKTMKRSKRLFLSPTQTELFGGERAENGETDLVLR
jgi:hypothetical protein